MKVQAVFPDVERLVKDLLATLIADHEPDVTVGVGVPTGWTSESPAHLEVAWDGTPDQTPPIVAHPTVRIIARSASTTEAKRLAALAQGLLLAHGGGQGITGIRPLAGVLPARDPSTQAELASISVRVTVRSEPITSS